MMSKYVITPDYVRQILDYDPDTGVFVWKTRPLEHFKTKNSWSTWNSRYANTQAGCIDACEGYHQIYINGKKYKSHFLAFVYITGRWPTKELDHHNGNKSDNRIANLRESTHPQNMANAFWSSNTSGKTGVHFRKDNKKWRAYIYLGGKQTTVGHFDTFDEAVKARLEAEQTHHGEFAYSARPKDS